jgi:hypothetical protein
MAQTANSNHLGPTVTFGNGSAVVGIQGKWQLTEDVFEVDNSISLRPFARFPESSTEAGAAITYDFNLPRYKEVTPYLGLGVASFNGTSRSTNFFGVTTTRRFSEVAIYGQGGVDINVSSDWSLSAALQVPFNNLLNSNVSLGANYRF